MKAGKPLAIAAVVSMVFSSLILSAGPAAAACATDQWKPQLRDVTINQGLGSYTPLVRGKQTVVVFFTSGPQCANADEWVRIRSATLTVTAAEKTTTLNLVNSTPKVAVRYDQSTPENGFAAGHTANPTFIVPGSALEPAATGPYPLTVSAEITYDAVRISGSTTTVVVSGAKATFNTLNNTPITAPVEKTTLPMRLLAVPIGLNPDPAINNTPLANQFTTNAITATNQAFDNALMRFLPVKHGRSNLSAGSQDAGLRVSLLDASRVLVPEAFTAGVAPSKKFCGTGSRFTQTVRPKLQSFLLDYNTSQRDPATGQPSAQFVADRVMGIVDQAMWTTCAHGFAGIGTMETWVSARYGSGSPAWTGALMGQELGHNAGAVPCGADTKCEAVPGLDRDDQLDPQHSQAQRADVTAPLRAYNTLLPDYLNGAINPTENRTVMNLLEDGTWVNDAVLYEKPDWDLMLCKLGGPPTDDCGLYPQANVTGAGGGPPTQTISIAGTTDMTPAGTNVFTSYAAPGPTIPPQAGSVLSLVQKSGGSVTSTEGIPTSTHTSVHDEDGHPHSGDNLTYFYGEFQLRADTDRFEVRNGNTLLYARNKDRAPLLDDLILSTPEDPFPAGATVIDFDEATNHIGDRITTQYQAQGVTFEDPPTGSTPRISGMCPPNQPLSQLIPQLQEILASGETPPCRTGSTASSPYSLRNNQTVGQNTALTMTFSQPQALVRMSVGNGAPTGGTQATLQALDASGNPIAGLSETKAVGLNTNTIVNVSAPTPSIHGARLSYNSTNQQEELDTLVFSTVQGTPPTAPTLIARVNDDSPNMKMSWFGVCPSEVQPLDSGDSPDQVNGPDANGIYRGIFTFEPILEAGCINQGALNYRARLTDGFQTDTKDSSIAPPGGVTNHPPEAIISIPTGTLEILENNRLPLIGHGFDVDEGLITANNKVSWKVEGPGLASPITSSGADIYVDPPTGGWPVPAGQNSADYTVTLTVTDSAGLTDSSSTTATILADDDADGVARRDELCSGGSDTDPRDQVNDLDGDGLWNWADPLPCVAHKDFRATIVQIEPDHIIVSSGGGDFTVRFKLPFHDETKVDGKTIRISRLATTDLTGNQWLAKRTSVENGAVVAKFDRQKLIDFFLSPANADLRNSQVLVTVSGEGIAPGGFRYKFVGDDTVEVREK